MASHTVTAQQPSKLRLFYQQQVVIDNDPFPLFQRDQIPQPRERCQACQDSQSLCISQSSSSQKKQKGSDEKLRYLPREQATTMLQLNHGKPGVLKANSKEIGSSSSLKDNGVVFNSTNMSDDQSRSRVPCFLDRDDNSSQSGRDQETYGLDFLVQSPTPTLSKLKQQLNKELKYMKINNQNSGSNQTISILCQDKKLKKKMSEASYDSSENDFMSISTDEDQDQDLF